MSERVIKEGDIVKVFLSNNFIYKGKVLAVDNAFLKILDFKTDSEKVFPLSSITDINIIKEVEK